MTSPLPHGSQGGLPITAVERETGLSKDTLRVWEKRYGFPQPLRDAADDRRYPLDQVQRLKLIRRLLDAGYRPGKVAGLNDGELKLLLDKTPNSSKTNHQTQEIAPNLVPLLNAIEAHDSQGLRYALSHAQMRMGLAPFVNDVVAPLTTAVGDAWAQGRFEIFEEHLFTEVISSVLRGCIATLNTSPGLPPPKVLLTTLPQEQHGLGLLMVEALLLLEGCQCVCLGTQTPMTDIVRAAQAHQVDAVALSFSNLQGAAAVQTSLRTLRSELSADTAIWVGGSCQALYQKTSDGITALQSLQGVPTLVAQWRETHCSL